MTAPESPERGRGRPPIGKPLTVRVPPQLRARLADAALPGEAIADTVRRLLDLAADLTPLTVQEISHALAQLAGQYERQAAGRTMTGEALAAQRAELRAQASANRELAARLHQDQPLITRGESMPNRRRAS